MTVTVDAGPDDATVVAGRPRGSGAGTDRVVEARREVFALGPLAVVLALTAIVVGRNVDETGSIVLRAVLVIAWAGAGMALFTRPVLRRLAVLVLGVALLASVGLV